MLGSREGGIRGRTLRYLPLSIHYWLEVQVDGRRSRVMEKINAYRASVGKSEERGHLESISTDGDNINMDLKTTWTWRHNWIYPF
jgi:hypothetical protein